MLVPPMGDVAPETLRELDRLPRPAWTQTMETHIASTPWAAAMRASAARAAAEAAPAAALSSAATSAAPAAYTRIPVTVGDDQDGRNDVVMMTLPFRSFTFYRPMMQLWLECYQRAGSGTDEMCALVYFPEVAEGPGGCAHGGAVGSAFDELLGFTNWRHGSFGPTLQLSVAYRRATPLLRPLFMVGRVERLEGRKVHLSGQLRLDDTPGSTVLATVTALWYNQAVAGAPAALVSTAMNKRPGAVAGTPDWLHALRANVDCVPQDPDMNSFEDDQDLMQQLGHIGRNFITRSGKVRMESFHRKSDDAVLTVLHVSNFTQGPPGCVNGGCLYACIDDAAGRAAWSVHRMPGYTKSMTIQYRKFTRIVDRYFLIELRLRTKAERTATMEAVLLSPATGVVHCTATIVFASPADQAGPRLHAAESKL